MAPGNFTQFSFLGGEISQAAQGRMDLPTYKISMNVCLNGIPIEAGAWQRRPGTRHVAHHRGGAPGRGITFSFHAAVPQVMQLTDGILRFTSGTALVTTNDAQAITAISAANPAQVTTQSAHGWPTGATVIFTDLGANNPLLQNRQFAWTSTGTTTGTIADAITGASINGSTLGAFVSGNIKRVLEITTPWTSGSWASLRSVQAEDRSVLLNGTAPYVLQTLTDPTPSQAGTFSLGAANFLDGPYLDVIAGSQCTPGALNGLIALTFSFQTWDATRAYNVGDFVTYVGANYQNNTPLNLNNPPNSSGTWTAVSGGAPINSGRGFVPSDVGRLLRLFSEPQLYSTIVNYAIGSVVAYSNGNGGFAYWTAIGAINQSVTPVQPGQSTSWAPNPTGAQWTWGKITAVSATAVITPQLSFGTMSGSAGTGAAFDGNTSKSFGASATFSSDITTAPGWFPANWPIGTVLQFAASQGNNYFYQLATVNINPELAPPNDPEHWHPTGLAVSPTFSVSIGQNYFSLAQQVAYGTVYPTTDLGFTNSPAGLLTINMRGKTTAPSSAADGVLLGAAVNVGNVAAITIVSSDQTTHYSYVWFEFIVNFPQPLADLGTHIFTAKIGAAQAQFFAPNVSNGATVTCQLIGSALLYNQTIRTWRLGAYSNTTGWPTCGTYARGRIWLGGAIQNRFDAGVSNGISGANLNFAPTGPGGVVSDDNAIAYTLTGENVNPILWMKPDQQGVLFGTKSGEYLISQAAPGVISPTNIQTAELTSNGCADIEPRRTEHTLVVVHKAQRKINEYFPDVFSGKFTAPNLAVNAKHLTVGLIAEIAYQQELAPIVWMRRGDGVLVGTTYKRDTLMTSQGPTVNGWHRHSLGSGRSVESIATGPSGNGTLDALTMTTNDPASGIRHIEVMGNLLDEGFSLTDCCFLDDAIVPSSTLVQLAPTGGAYGSLVVNGLWAHNGKSVTAWIAGLDCGEFTVASGSITIPFGDGVSGGTGSGLFTAALVNLFPVLPAFIGFNYNSDGQTVRAVDVGPSGTTFAKNKRYDHVGVQLYGCVNGSFALGTDFTTLYPAKLQQPNETPYTVQQLWSGVYRDSENSGYDFDGMIAWRISRPYPACVTAIGGQSGGG